MTISIYVWLKKVAKFHRYSFTLLHRHARTHVRLLQNHVTSSLDCSLSSVMRCLFSPCHCVSLSLSLVASCYVHIHWIASHEILIIHTIAIKINAYLFWEWIMATNGGRVSNLFKVYFVPFKHQWCEKFGLIYWKCWKCCAHTHTRRKTETIWNVWRRQNAKAKPKRNSKKVWCYEWMNCIDRVKVNKMMKKKKKNAANIKQRQSEKRHVNHSWS